MREQQTYQLSPDVSVYRKSGFSAVFTNFEILISRSLIDLVYAPIWKNFITKLIIGSQTSKNNSIQETVSTCASKKCAQDKVILAVPKLQLVCMLPYRGKSSFDLRTCLRCTIEEKIAFSKLSPLNASVALI